MCPDRSAPRRRGSACSRRCTRTCRRPRCRSSGPPSAFHHPGNNLHPLIDHAWSTCSHRQHSCSRATHVSAPSSAMSCTAATNCLPRKARCSSYRACEPGPTTCSARVHAVANGTHSCRCQTLSSRQSFFARAMDQPFSEMILAAAGCSTFSIAARVTVSA